MKATSIPRKRHPPSMLTDRSSCRFTQVPIYGEACWKEISIQANIQDLVALGSSFLRSFEQEMEANPDKRYGIVTFKWIVDAFKEEWQKAFFHNSSIVRISIARKAQTPAIDVLFVVGTPEVPDSAIIKKAKLIFGGTEFATQPLDTTRSDRSLNNGCPYSEWRMQVAWRHAVLEIVIQAIGRARLNLYPRTVVAITGIRVPTLTDREDTVLFDIQDWTVAGTLDKLPDEATRTATAREAQKQRQNEIDQRLENGESWQSIANTEGITHWDVRKVASARRARKIVLEHRAEATLVDKVQDYINKNPDGHTTRSIINTFSDYHPSSVKNALAELVASDKSDQIYAWHVLRYA